MRKKTISLLVVFALLCSITLPVYAVVADQVLTGDESAAATEQKVYSTATLEDDFADDRVLVVLSNDASTSLHTYTSADFAGSGCAKVENLSYYTTNLVNANLTGKTTYVQQTATAAEENTVVFENFGIVDTEKFQQVLCLTLEKSGKQNVLDTIKLLMTHPDVVYAGPDYTVTAAAVNPNDPRIGEQWAINKIQLRNAWSYSTGSSSIRVGVADTGIDGSHPELSSKINVALSRDFTSGSSATVSSVTDPHGHGTHVAGIIGAATNNGTGISGTCFQVELVSLRVLDWSGDGYVSNIVTAIEYAISRNIPIINMSLAIPGSRISNADDRAFSAAISNYNGLIVCAAGNANNNVGNAAVNIDNITTCPGSYTHSNIITVGASTQSDTRLASSNYGAVSVDLFAPGDGILSCNTGGGYQYLSGTSMAAPYVTGVAVLILAKYRTLTPQQVKSRIMEGTDPVNSLSGLCVSGGRLNAYKAIHSHGFSYTTTGVLAHTKSCSCGISLSQPHTWTSSGSIYTCSYCGQTTSVLPYSHSNESA